MAHYNYNYTIQEGDTLGGISALYFGDTKFYKNLAQYNSIGVQDKLKIGQILIIPDQFYSIERVERTFVNGKRTYKMHMKRNPGENLEKDASVYYAPGRNEFFIVEEADFESFKTEVIDNAKVAKEIKDFRNENPGSNKERTEKAKEIEKKVSESFKGLTKDPEKAIQELLLIRSNSKTGTLSKRVYIRPYKTKNGDVKGHFRKNTDVTVQKHLTKWLKKEAASQNPDGGMDKKLKALICQSEQLDNKWPWEFKTLKTGEKAKEGVDTVAGYFSGSAEAQFFRFVAGAKAEFEFDLTEMKLKLAGSLNVSYSLAEGTVTGQWNLPGKDGFDIYAHLKLSDNARDAIKAGYKCLFRITIKAEGKAFAGASITAVAGLPSIDLSSTDQLDKEIKMGLKGNTFAGVSLEGKIGALVEWDEQGAKSFASLAGISAVASGNIGAGVGANFEIEYKNGKFHFECGAMAVVGIGGKGGLAFELGIDETIELFAHLFNSVDFHRIDSVGALVFQVLLNASFAQFIVVGKVTDAILDKTKDFFGWLGDEKKNKDKYRKTKSTIRINLNNPKILKGKLPEALGQLIITIMEVPEEQDFDDILRVLKSADGNQHKLKWILRSVFDSKLSVKGGDKGGALDKGIRKLLEFGGYFEEDRKNKKIPYLQNLFLRLKKNGITHNYDTDI